jgi:hypothetical protein
MTRSHPEAKMDSKRLKSALETMPGWRAIELTDDGLRIVTANDTVRQFYPYLPAHQDSQAFLWMILEAMPKGTYIQPFLRNGDQKGYVTWIESECDEYSGTVDSFAPTRAESLLLAFCAWRESLEPQDA